MSDLTKANIEQLVEARLSEAISLFEKGHFSGAYYLGGYAIELAVKACIANVFQKGTIPDRRFVNSVYDHNLTALIKIAGLEAERKTKAEADADFAQNWEYVAAWSESVRYQLIEEDKARSLIEAFTRRGSRSPPMDQDVLVEGGAEGLNRIAQAFRSKGLPVSGVYLIKLTSHDGFEEWVVRLVADRVFPDLKRQMIFNLIELRREKALPRIETGVRFDLVDPKNDEASRIIEYTRRLGGPPALIRDTMWMGLFIEYALVASVPQTSFVPA